MSQKKVNPKVQEYNPGRGASILSRELIPAKYLSLVLIALLFILVSVVYFPVAYRHMEPAASDISQWRELPKALLNTMKPIPIMRCGSRTCFPGCPAI